MFAGGGFGGDQFAGGGFMPSQAPTDNQFGGGSGGGRGGSSKQTLRTLTIRQLWKAASDRDDDGFKVDGVELSNVTVLGKITNVRETNQALTLTITDGTGSIEVDHYPAEDPDLVAQKRAEWQPGTYIRAYGHLMRKQQGGISLNGFNVRTVTDFNEVTYHNLRCIFEHAHFTKGGAAGQGMQGMNGPGGMAAAAAAPAWQGGGGGMQQATVFAGAVGGGMGSNCQNAVLQIIQGCNSDLGVFKNDLYGQLHGRFGQQEIDVALQQLTNEALVYTTTDDDHFRAA